MSRDSRDGHEMRRYLLGEMTEEERSSFEEALFAEDQIGRELLEAEDDLIDDSLCGRLGTDEERHFEANFLVSPRRRRKMSFAAALGRQAARVAAGTPLARDGRAWFGRWAAGLAAAAAVVAVLAFPRLESPVAPVAQSERAPTPDRTASGPEPRGGAAQSAEPPPVRVEADTSHLVLLATSVRGAGNAGIVRVSPATQWIEIEAFVESRTGLPESCRVVVATPSGQEVWSQTVALQRVKGGRRVLLRLRANRLGADDYLVTLRRGEGAPPEELASYFVRVMR